MQTTLESSAPLVHGPTKSTRLGIFLSVDVTAPQRNMVVERGSSLPRASVVVTTAARRIIELSKAGEKVENVVVTGSDGDPTTHPDLREITENLRALRDKWFSRAKLSVVTEARELDAYEIRSTLGLYDRVYLRFEWGTAKAFTAATGEKGPVLTALTKQLSSLDHVIVQANFFSGDIDNSAESEVTQWLKRLQDVKPQEIQILPGAGVVKARKKKVKTATPNRRKQIADLVADRGLSVSVHDEDIALV